MTFSDLQTASCANLSESKYQHKTIAVDRNNQKCYTENKNSGENPKVEKNIFYDNIKKAEQNTSASPCIMKFIKTSDEESVILSVHPSDFFVDYHAHEFFEFNYVLRGNCINVVEGKSVQMEEGDILLMPPGVYHAVFASRESYILNISVASDFLPKICEDFKKMPSLFTDFLSSLDKKECYMYFICRGAKELKPIILDMISKCLRRFNPKYYKEDEFLGYLCEIYIKNQNLGFYNFLTAEIRLKEFILLMIYNNMENFELPERRKRNSAIMVNIIEYVNRNYENITLPSLAEHFHYSETHISRLLKKKTGLSFSGLLISVRLSHALVLLCNKNIPISKISRMIGYDAPSYFYRLFKKEFGITPLEYREKYSL